MIFKQCWQGKNCRTGESFPAEVPGNIQYDFGVFKNFGDINFSDNYKNFLPYEDDAWEYSTKLEYTKKEGEKVFLVTEGIIYKYDIFLGDEKIYSYEGMFKPLELDLTDKLKGNDLLRIYIYPHPKCQTDNPYTRDEAAQSCMPPVCYGWDWNPRLLVSGLWQETYIETRSENYIEKPEALTDLSDDFSIGTVKFNFNCAKDCLIEIFDANGKAIYRGADKTVLIKKPELWWCSGQGKPYLYSYRISNGYEETGGRFGFKKLLLVRNANSEGPSEFPKGRYEAPITIELNGRRIFAKGSNFLNPDIFWGRVTKERLKELVLFAKNCNMNIFRVWGGSGLAKNKFYELCDSNGIMLWQEFPLACNNYLGTKKYLETLESESVAIIKKLRSHPSLALWCGGNELFNNWSGMDDQSPALRLLNSNCFIHDPSKPFLMTSPLYGMAHGGYTFFDKLQGGEVYNEFIRASNTAYTEFGVPSVSSVETLKSIIPENELFPPRKSASWVAHHGFDAWGEERWLCLPILEKYFGKAESIEELVINSKLLQSEGYRAAFEEARRQWPRCSMAINWCFNEPWKTAANNSIIEYPFKPKPCCENIRNALRPTLFSARIKKFSWQEGEIFEAELWLLNDSEKAFSGEVKASLIIGDKRIELLKWKAEAGNNKNTIGPTVRTLLPEAEADKMSLILEGSCGTSSTYTLQYLQKNSERKSLRILNM